jgi:RNA polymerase sigma-70 factor (ECF subfamily)
MTDADHQTHGEPRSSDRGEIDDQTLVVRAQEGDVRAFETLLRRYQRPMFSLAYRMLNDRGEAEDAVQEAFTAAWRRLAGFRGDAAFSSWLYRIVSNRCLNQARRRRPTPTEADEWLADPGGAGSPERETEADAAVEALGRAVADLPAEQRVCWVLRSSEGLGYEEIAEIVGITPDAARGRIHRARQQLVKAMAPWR